jgi:hypothetical protein
VAGARGPYDWQFGISVQQELMPRVSVEAGYYRRWWPIFTTADITDNINTTAADYARFSVYAPSDPRLPNGGGYAVPGIYNINAAPSLVVPSNVQKAANSFGSYTRYWDGIDVTAQARLRNGVNLQGGTSTGRPVLRSVRAARHRPGKRAAQPVLPSGRAVADDIQGHRQLRYPARGRERGGHILKPPGCGALSERHLHERRHAESGEIDVGPQSQRRIDDYRQCHRTNSMLGDRIDQLDIRVGKILRFGRTRTNLNLDIVNALNSNDNLGYSGTFGATWPAPTSVLTARLFRLSAQLDF